MDMRGLGLGIVAGALAVSACATSPAGSSGDRDLLTRTQLEAVSYGTAYEAVRRFRPIWLRSERGADSFIAQGMRGLRIYVDGVYYGEVESLRTLQVQDIEEIRYLDKREATLEFGTNHGEGALMITTRR